MYLKCKEYFDFEAIATKQLGYIYMEQQKIDQAIEAFQRSLELDSVPKTAFLIGKLHA